MRTKLNLALVPVKKSNVVVDLSQTLSEIADAYVLGENSLPHVTLYQFEIDEEEIDNLWIKVQAKWDEEPVEIEFDRFSCISFDQSTYWVSLLPKNIDVINNMHAKIAELLGRPTKKSFDPHMTLINTKNKDYEKEVDKISATYCPLWDMLILKLGKCDEIGQFTEVIYSV